MCACVLTGVGLAPQSALPTIEVHDSWMLGQSLGAVASHDSV
jgi:hypothetical protein